MKRILSIVCLVYACIARVGGQDSKVKLLKEADYYYSYKNYELAEPFFREYLKSDSLKTMVNFNLGICIYNTRFDKTEAIKYFERAVNDYPESYFYLGRMYHYQGEFDRSLHMFDLYRQKGLGSPAPDSVVGYYEAQVKRARQVYSRSNKFSVTNLGDGINSPYPDYVPVLARDESVMFFTSRRGKGDDLKDPMGNYYEDIYWSIKYEDGWGKARSLGFPVNTQTHESCLGVEPDLSKIYLYRTNPEGTGGGVYESSFDKDNQSWSSPKLIKAAFNSKDPGVKTVCLTASPDSNLYYFVSNMPGGYGGTDIWRITKFPNKEWSMPENLGAAINTPYDEDSPTFFPDENTMYFSSKGHNGIGDFDVFRSTREGDQWTRPVNLGFPVNSVRDDRFFSISPDGKRGYFSSERFETHGGSDIYMVEMEQVDDKFVVVKGSVRDTATNVNLTAEITLVDIQNKSIQGVYRPNKLTGKFIILVKRNVMYSVEVRVAGYVSVVKPLSIPFSNKGDVELNIQMIHE